MAALDIPPSGLQVHLRGFGMMKVFRTVDAHGNTDDWMTSRLRLTEAQRQGLAERAWLGEGYHRAVKQLTGIERGQFRLERSQRNHIGLALRAYVHLECQRWQQRGSIFESKREIVRAAVRRYMAHPLYCFLSTA